MQSTPEQNLKKLGIILPSVAHPIGTYVNCVRVGDLLFLSGKGPLKPDEKYITGKLGKDLSVEEGYEAGRLVAIAHIAVLKEELGELKKVKRIVKVTALVNCTDNFTEQPKVTNGYSDLMVQVFGEKGHHARSAVGTNALPLNIAVEVEVIVEIGEKVEKLSPEQRKRAHQIIAHSKPLAKPWRSSKTLKDSPSAKK